MPHITSADDRVWTTPAFGGSGIYYISDPTPTSEHPEYDRMIELSNISVSTNTNQIQLTALMKFVTENNDKVATDQYNLFGMANDLIGFTAYETDGIKDSNIWADSTTDWNLDMEEPQITNISTANGSVENTLDLSFEVTDGEKGELAFVRVDACHSEQDTTSIPIFVDGRGFLYDLDSCDNRADIDDIDAVDLISDGPLTEFPDGTKTFTETVSIDVNDINGITFYITAMDKAGNYSTSQQILKFGDWAIIKDGLVFGNEGASSPTRGLQENSWDITTSNISEEGCAIADNLDLTNQVLLGGETTSISFLGDLGHSSSNLSFKASKFSGVPITDVYSELMNAYRSKQIKNPELFELHDYLDLTTNPCEGSAEYCVISSDSDTDITIPSTFECNSKTLITSGGNIIIRPDFLNSTNSDACIILAIFKIIIVSGSTGTEDIYYDVIQAFLIAGNNIVIEEDPSDDGLIVQGGLVAFGSQDTGISNIIDSRTIPFGYRDSYPVIAVNNNAKYGLLSTNIFGSQVEMFKLEIGFKPY